MRRSWQLGACAALSLSAIALSSCGRLHGQPQAGPEVPDPRGVIDFSVLYGQNCAGCHGADGRGGASIELANPVYLAIVDQSSLRKEIAGGVPGTSMPAFAQSAGGMLTNQQVNAIVSGMLSRWQQKGILDGTNPPAYAAKSPGDAEQGGMVYKNYCASCHGPSGSGGPKGSSITDDSYLALVSNQGLRTVIVAGRPELGAPDWRGDVPGTPMTDEQVTDVVAWIASHRVPNPGQPYSATNTAQNGELPNVH